jgi:hypothetical protein
VREAALRALLRDEVRSAVRAELAEVRVPEAPEPEEEAEADEGPSPAPPSAEVEERARLAQSLLEEAAGSGRISVEDHERLHGLLAHLPRPRQETILSALHRAINAQELTLATPQ